MPSKKPATKKKRPVQSEAAKRSRAYVDRFDAVWNKPRANSRATGSITLQMNVYVDKGTPVVVTQVSGINRNFREAFEYIKNQAEDPNSICLHLDDDDEDWENKSKTRDPELDQQVEGLVKGMTLYKALPNTLRKRIVPQMLQVANGPVLPQLSEVLVGDETLVDAAMGPDKDSYIRLEEIQAQLVPISRRAVRKLFP